METVYACSEKLGKSDDVGCFPPVFLMLPVNRTKCYKTILVFPELYFLLLIKHQLDFAK